MKVLKVRTGDATKAKIIAKVLGTNVDVPPLPFTGPVLVQLRADNGACFEAEYQPADFIKNDAEQFKSKGGAPLP